MKLSPQGIISICSSEKLCWSQVKIADNVEQFPQRWETDPIGDAADVRAALAQVQAHAVLRYILLCPQVCDSAAQKGFVPPRLFQSTTPFVSYYFNISRRLEMVFILSISSLFLLNW